MSNPLERRREIRPELTKTDPEVVEALTKKMKEVAEEKGIVEVTDADFRQAAFYAALTAERSYMPFTLEAVEKLSADDERFLKESLEERIGVKAGESKTHLIDSHGDHHSTVANPSEIASKASEIRASEQ